MRARLMAAECLFLYGRSYEEVVTYLGILLPNGSFNVTTSSRPATATEILQLDIQRPVTFFLMTAV